MLFILFLEMFLQLSLLFITLYLSLYMALYAQLNSFLSTLKNPTTNKQQTKLHSALRRSGYKFHSGWLKADKLPPPALSSYSGATLLRGNYQICPRLVEEGADRNGVMFLSQQNITYTLFVPTQTNPNPNPSYSWVFWEILLTVRLT